MASGVEFDEDKYGMRPASASVPGARAPAYDPYAAQKGSKMAQWLIKKGIAKSPSSANAILLVLVIINFVITFIVLKFLL